LSNLLMVDLPSYRYWRWLPNSLVADAGQRSFTVNAPRCSSTSIAIGTKRVTSTL
jgi:hypothetical protein